MELTCDIFDVSDDYEKYYLIVLRTFFNYYHIRDSILMANPRDYQVVRSHDYHLRPPSRHYLPPGTQVSCKKRCPGNEVDGQPISVLW